MSVLLKKMTDVEKQTIPHASVMKQLRCGAHKTAGADKMMIQSKCAKEVSPFVAEYIESLCRRLHRVMLYSNKTTVTKDSLAVLGLKEDPEVKCMLSKEACFRIVKSHMGGEYRFTADAKWLICNAVCRLVDALGQQAAAAAKENNRKIVTDSDILSCAR